MVKAGGSSLEEIIRYELEGSALDFKGEQYRKEKHWEFLKDAIALANSSAPADRHIIIGVPQPSAGQRHFLGIAEPLVDAATYQQLLHENVEPEIISTISPSSSTGRLSGSSAFPNAMTDRT